MSHYIACHNCGEPECMDSDTGVHRRDDGTVCPDPRDAEVEGLRAELADANRRADEAEAQIKRARDYVDERGIARGLGGHYGLREVIKQQIARAEAAEAEVERLRAAALPEDAEERITAALRDRDIRTIMGGSPAYGDDARAILEALRGQA